MRKFLLGLILITFVTGIIMPAVISAQSIQTDEFDQEDPTQDYQLPVDTGGNPVTNPTATPPSTTGQTEGGSKELISQNGKSVSGGRNTCISSTIVPPTMQLNMEVCAAQVANLSLVLSSRLVFFSTKFLDTAIYYSVLNMKSFVFGDDSSKGIVGLTEGWKIIRDLINISFIFIILYIAISTILQGGGNTGSLLVKVIIAALLINFSLFFTKVIIDATNIVAIGFHNAAVGGGGLNMGELLFKEMKLESTYSYNPDTGRLLDGQLDWYKIMLIGFFGSVTFMITAFVMFAAGILFMIRFVILIILMMLSPIGFAGGAVPKLQDYVSLWWSKLINHAIFAPIYMILMFIGMKVLVGVAQSLQGPGKLQGMADVFAGTNTSTGSFAIIMNFAIIIIFLIATLIISKQLGVVGAGKMISVGKSLRDFGIRNTAGQGLGLSALALRNVLGRKANDVANSEKLKNARAEGGIGGLLASATIATGEKGAKSSWDVRASGVGKDMLGGDKMIGKAGGKGGYETQAKADKKRRDEWGQQLAINRRREADDAEKKYNDALKKDNEHASASDYLKNAKEKHENASKEHADKEKEFAKIEAEKQKEIDALKARKGTIIDPQTELEIERATQNLEKIRVANQNNLQALKQKESDFKVIADRHAKAVETSKARFNQNNQKIYSAMTEAQKRADASTYKNQSQVGKITRETGLYAGTGAAIGAFAGPVGAIAGGALGGIAGLGVSVYRNKVDREQVRKTASAYLQKKPLDKDGKELNRLMTAAELKEFIKKNSDAEKLKKSLEELTKEEKPKEDGGGDKPKDGAPKK